MIGDGGTPTDGAAAVKSTEDGTAAPFSCKIYSKVNIYSVGGIDTQAQTWEGIVDFTLLLPLSRATCKEQSISLEDADDILIAGEKNSGRRLWSKLSLKLLNRVEASDEEAWLRVATEDSTYTIKDVVPGAGPDDVLVVIRWRFLGKFTTPFSLRFFPLDSQQLNVDMLTTRERVCFADGDELAAFNGRWQKNHQPKFDSLGADVDGFRVEWCSSLAASEFLAPRRMEPPHVFSHATPHRRFFFTVFRNPTDIYLNVVAPVFLCTGLGLLTAIGLPSFEGNSADGDLSTSASFFLASIGARAATSDRCPKMSEISALELYNAASMFIHVVAFLGERPRPPAPKRAPTPTATLMQKLPPINTTEKYVGRGGSFLEIALWASFCLLNAVTAALYFNRDALGAVTSVHRLPCAFGCGAPLRKGEACDNAACKKNGEQPRASPLGGSGAVKQPRASPLGGSGAMMGALAALLAAYAVTQRK
jgi:hypothetical protein